MRSLSRREKKIFYVCLAVAFIYLNLTFIVHPVKTTEGRIRHMVLMADQEFAQGQRMIKNGRKIDEEYVQLLAPVIQKRSDDDQMATVLSEVESSAGQVNVHIVNLKPAGIKRIDFYKRYGVDLSIEGQFKDIMMYLYSLQHEPYYFRLEKLTLDKNDSLSSVDCYVELSRLFVPEDLVKVQ